MRKNGHHKKLRTHFVIQHDQTDCGVACLLSIIRYYDGSDTLENLRRLSGTNITGTTLLGLYQAATQCGFTAQGCESDMQGLLDHGSPCILHVVIDGKMEHYVVCYAVSLKSAKKSKELQFLIGDPGKGITYLSETELDKMWKSKTCLVLEPNESFQRRGDIRQNKRKWIVELIRVDYPILVIAAALGVVIAALSMIMAIFSQKLIDDLLPNKEYSKLYLGIGLVFLLLLIKEGLSVLRQFFLISQSKDFNIRIIDFFYHQLLQLPKSFFDSRKIGEFTARLTDTSRIQRVISQLAGSMVIDILMTVVAVVFIFFYSWHIGVICLLAMPVFFWLVYLHNKKIIEGQRSIMVNYAMVEGNYISTLQGIEPIKNNNKQVLYASQNKSIYERFQMSVFSLGKIQIRLSFLANAFGVIFLMGILTFTSYQVLSDQLKVGELIAILGMCGTLLPSVASLAVIAIPINEAKIAFDRMFEFTSIKPEHDTILRESVRFEKLSVNNVSFRFAGRRQIIKNVSLEVNKGEVVAIMGENGCGKSTLVQIFQKFYRPESGEIILNNAIPLNQLSVSHWRKTIGVVPQNIHIFNGTVFENIAFDDMTRKPEDVIAFLQEYGFAEFIDSLPQSLMTLVGEEGINLSGGQKQMIALARALYHRPQLLILDEATAAMDRDSEQFVLQLIRRLKHKIGIIFITHRLHILKLFCDRIYIVEHGQISDYGDHHQLLKTENLYSNYWNDLVS